MSKISYNLIFYTFCDDDDINKYCDADYEYEKIKKIVRSIYKKIKDYEKLGNCDFYDLVVDNEIVGYSFNHKNLLVSFGVNKKYRTKDKLLKVFEIIKYKFGGNFESYMWTRNTRAINWLKKCGMTEIESKIDNVTKLEYICQ